MVVCQTMQCHMAAVSQSLKAGSNHTSGWSAPLQLWHQVTTNIIPVMQLMAELEGIPLREKQRQKEQVSFWENELN